mgnify:CR=1 FL=1
MTDAIVGYGFFIMPQVKEAFLKVLRENYPNKTEEELMQFVAEHLAEREPIYLRAKHILHTTELNLSEINLDFMANSY